MTKSEYNAVTDKVGRAAIDCIGYWKVGRMCLREAGVDKAEMCAVGRKRELKMVCGRGLKTEVLARMI